MSTAAKLIGFAAGLVLVFAAAALAGGALDPSPPRKASPAASHGGDAEMGGGATAMKVRGLAVDQDGLRLVVANTAFERGRAQQLRFRVVNDDTGATVKDFDVEHTKRMHLIVVRRDLTNFQHLHPTQQPDGSWSVPLRIDEPGSYRVFADFSHDDTPTTLASDLSVDGAATLEPLPAATATATTDGYTVRKQSKRIGDETELSFTILHAGKPVKVQPYLGANGHLVALREGDLAFLHVHPTNGVTFESTFPTTGRYRLFLQFKHDGRVHTAAFTENVS